MSDKFLDIAGITFQSMLTIAQTDEIFRIISLVLTIISAVVVLARNVYEWYLKAKKDGKITAEEVKQCTDIIIDGVQKVNNVIDENKKKTDK